MDAATPQIALLLAYSNDVKSIRGVLACWQVSDFGLSMLFKPGQEQAVAVQHGTLAYMPPELLTSDIISYATDVYSFGILMWEMIASKVWRPNRPALFICFCGQSRSAGCSAVAFSSPAVMKSTSPALVIWHFSGRHLLGMSSSVYFLGNMSSGQYNVLWFPFT